MSNCTSESNNSLYDFNNFGFDISNDNLFGGNPWRTGTIQIRAPNDIITMRFGQNITPSVVEAHLSEYGRQTIMSMDDGYPIPDLTWANSICTGPVTPQGETLETKKQLERRFGGEERNKHQQSVVPRGFMQQQSMARTQDPWTAQQPNLLQQTGVPRQPDFQQGATEHNPLRRQWHTEPQHTENLGPPFGRFEAHDQPKPSNPSGVVDLTGESLNSTTSKPHWQPDPEASRLLKKRIGFLVRKINDSNIVPYVKQDWMRWLNTFENCDGKFHARDWCSKYWQSEGQTWNSFRFTCKYWFTFANARAVVMSYFGIPKPGTAASVYTEEFLDGVKRMLEGDGEEDEEAFKGFEEEEDRLLAEREKTEQEFQGVQLQTDDHISKGLREKRKMKAAKQNGTWAAEKEREKELKAAEKRKREEEKEQRGGNKKAKTSVGVGPVEGDRPSSGKQVPPEQGYLSPSPSNPPPTPEGYISETEEEEEEDEEEVLMRALADEELDRMVVEDAAALEAVGEVDDDSEDSEDSDTGSEEE